MRWGQFALGVRFLRNRSRPDKREAEENITHYQRWTTKRWGGAFTKKPIKRKEGKDGEEK